MCKVLVLLLVLAGCSTQQGFGGHVEMKALQPEYENTAGVVDIEFNQDIAVGWQVFCGVIIITEDYPTYVVGIRYRW